MYDLIQAKNIFNTSDFWVSTENVDSILESILQKKTGAGSQKLDNKLVDMSPIFKQKNFNFIFIHFMYWVNVAEG